MRRADSGLYVPEHRGLVTTKHMPTNFGIVASSHADGGFTDPTDLANLEGWWDATDSGSLTLGGGGVVNSWSDLSGNGRTLSQGTNSKKPHSGTVTIGGLNALQFDGGDFLRVSSSFTAVTYLFVVHISNATGPSNFWSTNQSASIVIFAGNRLSNGSNLDAVTCFSGDGDEARVVNVVNGASSEIFVGGSSVASGNAGSNSTSVTTFTVGSDNTGGGGAFLTGYIGEVIIYSDVKDSTDLATLDDYLSTKWGV